MIEFWGEYIEIQIQDRVLTRNIVHIGINLVLILYADHVLYESRLDGREDIIPNIAREIRKIPSILLIFDRFFEIEFILIIPEIRVFIDMNEFESL